MIVAAVKFITVSFKSAVGDAVIELLRPIREEAVRLLADKAYLESVYRAGAEKASYVAEKTLRKVYKKFGNEFGNKLKKFGERCTWFGEKFGESLKKFGENP